MVAGDKVTIHIQDVSVVDNLFFMGPANLPSVVSLDLTFVKSGTPRTVMPSSADPVSPYNWAGQVWTATAMGSFSVMHGDGSFSARGTFSSATALAEVGTERNGVFVNSQ